MKKRGRRWNTPDVGTSRHRQPTSVVTSHLFPLERGPVGFFSLDDSTFFISRRGGDTTGIRGRDAYDKDGGGGVDRLHTP